MAAAIGYVIFIGFGSWGGLHETALTVPGLPPYHHGLHPGDLLIGIARAMGDGLAAFGNQSSGPLPGLLRS